MRGNLCYFADGRVKATAGYSPDSESRALGTPRLKPQSIPEDVVLTDSDVNLSGGIEAGLEHGLKSSRRYVLLRMSR